MRRVRAIVFATALEMLSEPLVLLVTLAALALTVLAPVFHVHQFGDAGRMARDAGMSALLVGGSVIAAFGAVRTLRRELESGTALVALSHSVSRRAFFLAKAAGVAAGYAVFALESSLVSLAVVGGALRGAEIARRTGTLAQVYGPVLAVSVSAFVLPVVVAALLNRFGNRRFVLSANLLTLGFSALAFAVGLVPGETTRVAGAYLLAALPALLLLALAAAFSTRLRMNVAMTLAVIGFAAFLPALGNYCLSDALNAGGSVGADYLLAASAAMALPVAAALAAGAMAFSRSDLS